jgi:hypothetical protein
MQADGVANVNAGNPNELRRDAVGLGGGDDAGADRCRAGDRGL